MTEWYSNSWNDIVVKLNSNVRNGLNLSQVELLSKVKNKEDVLKLKRKNTISILWTQIKQIWIIVIIMLATFFIFLFNSLYLSAGIILILLLSSIFLSFFNEIRDNKRLNELEKLSPKFAKVVRDGKIMRINAEDLVIGDIVFVDKGESIPADLRIVESENLKVKETAITGEIYISEKYETKIEDVELSLSEMKNILFKSSTVVNGSGTGIVIAVDEDTQIGNIIKMFIEESETDNTFKIRIYKIINSLSRFSASTFFVSLIFGLIVGYSIKKVLLYSAIVSISSAPIIGIIETFIIAYIVLKNFRKNKIYLKDLSIVEKFTTLNVICMDKIGGFCANDMKVVKIYSDEKLIDVEDNKVIDETIYSIIKIGLICNDTIPEYVQDTNSRIELMERAFIKLGEDKNIIKSEIQRSNMRILQIQYDSERDMMTVINKVSDNKSIKFRAYTKGSVEGLLSRSTFILKNGIEKEIEPEDTENIKNMDNLFCNEGLSVLAFAYRNFTYKPSLSENIESNLVFVGITAFENPIKDGIMESLTFCKFNNIRPIIITEDNKLTAAAFGKAINIISEDEGVISGVELDNIDDNELKKNIEKINIFSKVKSEHKLRITKMLREQGYTIAFGGEKLADLPAIKSSDIGMAIGDRSSDILKNVTDISLKNISFSNIINLFKVCNRVIVAISKIIAYFFVCNIMQGSFVILGLLSGYKVTFEPIEIIWLNLYNIILGSIALLFQHENDKNILKSTIIDKKILKNFIDKKVILEACLILLLSFFTLVILYNHTSTSSSTTAFIIMAFSELILTVSFNDEFLFNNIKSNIIILFGIVIQFTIFFIPKEILGFNFKLNLDNWTVILISLLVQILLLFYVKLWINIKRKV